WAISKHAINSYRLPARSEIEPLAHHVFELLNSRERNVPGETVSDKRRRVAQADEEYSDAAIKLSNILLACVASKLKSKRLLVVTHSALRLVPFSVLPESNRQATASPLILHHEIVSIPSASALAGFRQRVGQRAHPPRTIAIVADPVFSNTDERFQLKTNNARALLSNVKASNKEKDPPAFEDSENDLEGARPRLFATRWEASTIARLVPSHDRSVALDFAANERFVTAPQFENYRILHFATHTLIDDEHPELSRIALSRYDPNGRQLDGFLYAHEIYRLRLPVDLVVLSSCRGATGKEVKGEGLVA